MARFTPPQLTLLGDLHVYTEDGKPAGARTLRSPAEARVAANLERRGILKRLHVPRSQRGWYEKPYAAEFTPAGLRAYEDEVAESPRPKPGQRAFTSIEAPLVAKSVVVHKVLGLQIGGTSWVVKGKNSGAKYVVNLSLPRARGDELAKALRAEQARLRRTLGEAELAAQSRMDELIEAAR